MNYEQINFYVFIFFYRYILDLDLGLRGTDFLKDGIHFYLLENTYFAANTNM